MFGTFMAAAPQSLGRRHVILALINMQSDGTGELGMESFQSHGLQQARMEVTAGAAMNL